MKIFLASLVTAAALTIASPALATENQNEGVCQPQSAHIQANTASVTVTAPEGKVITGYCVKAGSIQQGNGPEYVSVDNLTEVTITHSSGKTISHYIVFYADRPVDTTTTTPEVTTTSTLPDTTSSTTLAPTTTTSPTSSTVPITTAPESTTTSSPSTTVTPTTSPQTTSAPSTTAAPTTTTTSPGTTTTTTVPTIELAKTGSGETTAKTLLLGALAVMLGLYVDHRVSRNPLIRRR